MIRLLYFKCRIFLVMFVFLAAIFLGSVDVAASTAYTGMRGITAQQAVNEMGVGWNLGNTFDAPNETAWGNPTTTHAMIDKIKQQGFNTIRIPISWTGHFGGAPNYTIDSAWFSRVEQVMNYAFDNNMYVIINSHHDTSWQIPTYAYQSQGVNTITKIWTQIANRFKNYGDYLIFETLNEPRLVGSAEEWSGGTAEGRAVVNAYNLAAVNAIRATGGNNATRFIMVPTYAASAVPAAINDLVIPNNDSRVIVSLHMYSPWSFAGDYPGTSTWGSSSDISSLEAEFNAVYNVFGRNGRAVVIGEWGSVNKNNLSSRITHIQNYMKFARARGMATIWWDNGNANAGDDSWAIFNRWGLYWHFPDIANALVSNVGPATPTMTPTRTPTPTPVRTATPKPTPTATSHISTPTPTPVTGGYVVTYSIVNDWGTGATVNVTIKNNTSTAVNGWTLAWTFPGNQTVTNIWNATYTQSGASVTAKDAGYNAYISANGGEVNFGFNLNYTGTNAKPASFTLNGAACQVQ